MPAANPKPPVTPDLILGAASSSKGHSVIPAQHGGGIILTTIVKTETIAPERFR